MPNKRKPREIYDPDTGDRICGANKASGGLCKSPFVMTNGRCRMHGGATPRGPAAGSWKHGRSSGIARALPGKLRRAFKETMEDPNALSMLAEVSVLDARMTELYRKLSLRESEEGWFMLHDLVFQAHVTIDELRKELPVEDLAPLMAIVTTIGEVVEKGLSDQKTWKELYEVIELRKKLSDSEAKRKHEDELSFDRTQIVVFVGWLVHTLMEHVKDRKALTLVLNEVEKLIGPMERPREAEFTDIEEG